MLVSALCGLEGWALFKARYVTCPFASLYPFCLFYFLYHDGHSWGLPWLKKRRRRRTLTEKSFANQFVKNTDVHFFGFQLVVKQQLLQLHAAFIRRYKTNDWKNHNIVRNLQKSMYTNKQPLQVEDQVE